MEGEGSQHQLKVGGGGEVSINQGWVEGGGGKSASIKGGWRE